jgi:hypothetical protein
MMIILMIKKKMDVMHSDWKIIINEIWVSLKIKTGA